MDTWGRSTLLLLGATALAACPHDFTRRGRDGGASDGDARAGDRSLPRDLARETPCRTNADCVDPHPCTVDTCTSGGCAHVPTSGQCFIDGACYAAGELNPANRCDHCDPARPTRFTAFLDKGCVITLAGSTRGFFDGPADVAQFEDPTGIVVEPSSPVVYVADQLNHRIRSISGGIVSTLAGAGPGGLRNGRAADALFFSPRSVALSPLDGLVIADRDNNAIRAVDLNTVPPTVSTLVGAGTGFRDGSAATAKLKSPYTVAYGPGGIYFAADHRIRVIADDAPRTVSTLAGSGVSGFMNGPAASAQFTSVEGLAVLDQNNILVADTGNHRIRLIRRDGATTEVVTLAGTGHNNFVDGPGDQAVFSNPSGLAIGSSGSDLVLYVADRTNDCIRKVSLGTKVTVSTLGDHYHPGHRDGLVDTARFYQPAGLAVDGAGMVYVAELQDTIRVINP